MNTSYSVPLGENGRELLDRGTPLFPCSVYQRDIRQYIAGEITPHWHREMEIFVLESGAVRLTLADGEYDIRPGEGYFVNANILHGLSCRREGSCRYRSMVFDPMIVSGAPGSAFDALYIRPFTEKGAAVCILQRETDYGRRILELFDLAFWECKKEEEGYEFQVREALSRILLLLKKNTPDAGAKVSARRDARMKWMISWLDSHYSEPVTVSQLAKASGTCVRECQKIFSDFLHISPMQYLIRRRIAAAAELLEYSDLPVGEIGMNCGFESPSYFAKQFRELTGSAPREYRRRRRTERPVS